MSRSTNNLSKENLIFLTNFKKVLCCQSHAHLYTLCMFIDHSKITRHVIFLLFEIGETQISPLLNLMKMYSALSLQIYLKPIKVHSVVCALFLEHCISLMRCAVPLRVVNVPLNYESFLKNCIFTIGGFAR